MYATCADSAAHSNMRSYTFNERSGVEVLPDEEARRLLTSNSLIWHLLQLPHCKAWVYWESLFFDILVSGHLIPFIHENRDSSDGITLASVEHCARESSAMLCNYWLSCLQSVTCITFVDIPSFIGHFRYPVHWSISMEVSWISKSVSLRWGRRYPGWVV